MAERSTGQIVIDARDTRIYLWSQQSKASSSADDGNLTRARCGQRSAHADVCCFARPTTESGRCGRSMVAGTVCVYLSAAQVVASPNSYT